MSLISRWACRACGLYALNGPRGLGTWRVQVAGLKLSSSLREDSKRRIVRSREGVRLWVDGTSQVGRVIMATGEYESGTARVIKSLLAPGDVFADIGAHIGFFSVLAAGCVGAGGRVLSFEPAPRTRERLNQNIALNRLTNVTVFEEALGGQSAQTSLSIGPVDDTGLASLRGVLDADQCVDVRVRTFDGVFSSSERLAGVKIDVEGAEAKVLTGMSEQLRRHHPWVIAEITDSFLAEMGDSAEGLFSAMDRLGYEPYLLTDDEPSPIAVGRPLCDLPRQFNALFLPPGGDGRIRVERGFRSPKVF